MYMQLTKSLFLGWLAITSSALSGVVDGCKTQKKTDDIAQSLIKASKSLEEEALTLDSQNKSRCYTWTGSKAGWLDPCVQEIPIPIPVEVAEILGDWRAEHALWKRVFCSEFSFYGPPSGDFACEKVELEIIGAHRGVALKGKLKSKRYHKLPSYRCLEKKGAVSCGPIGTLGEINTWSIEERRVYELDQKRVCFALPASKKTGFMPVFANFNADFESLCEFIIAKIT